MPLKYRLKHDCEVFSSLSILGIEFFFLHKSSGCTIILIEVFFVISLVINETENFSYTYCLFYISILGGRVPLKTSTQFLKFTHLPSWFQELLCILDTRMFLFSNSVVSDSFVTPWSVACQALLSMGLTRQEYWSGLQFPIPGNLPNPGTEPLPPTVAVGFFTTEPPGETG